MSKYFQTGFLLIAIYVFSLSFYLKDLQFLQNKENVITSFDGYFYAYLTKQLLNENYQGIDYLTNVPDFSVFPYPVPMHSYFGYLIVKFLKVDMNTVFLFMSVLLAPMFVFTIYLYTQRFLPIYAFVSGAILGALNTVYFSRNLAGRFDTDSLILFFVFLLLFIMLKLLENLENIYKTIIYFTFFISSFNIFMWWYAKPLFASLFLVSLLIGYVSFYFKQLKDKRLLKNFSLIVSLYIISLWPFLKRGFSEILYKIFGYVFKQPPKEEFLPESITKFISELQPANYKIILSITFDNNILLIISTIGLILIFIRHFKYISVAIPIILIGTLSIKSGIRFLMYLMPFLGLGVGYLYYLIYSYLNKKFYFLNKRIYKIALFLIVVFSSFPVSIALIKPRPAISDELFYSLKKAKEKLEDNSYVWYPWSYGYPIKYILEKGVYVDNGNFNIIKNYAISNSLYTNSFERSYHLVSFITNHHYKDYSKLTFEDFNKRVNNYNKLPKNTVYFLLTKSPLYEISTVRLGVYGTDIRKFEIPMVKNITKCLPLEDNLYYCIDFIINTENKVILWTSRYNLKANIYDTIFINRDTQKYFKLPFKFFEGYEKNFILQIVYIPKNKEVYFSYVTPVFQNTVFNKLFFFRENNKYFDIVYDDFPTLVIYKVKN